MLGADVPQIDDFHDAARQLGDVKAGDTFTTKRRARERRRGRAQLVLTNDWTDGLAELAGRAEADEQCCRPISLVSRW